MNIIQQVMLMNAIMDMIWDLRKAVRVIMTIHLILLPMVSIHHVTRFTKVCMDGHLIVSQLVIAIIL